MASDGLPERMRKIGLPEWKIDTIKASISEKKRLKLKFSKRAEFWAKKLGLSLVSIYASSVASTNNHQGAIA